MWCKRGLRTLRYLVYPRARKSRYVRRMIVECGCRESIDYASDLTTPTLDQYRFFSVKRCSQLWLWLDCNCDKTVTVMQLRRLCDDRTSCDCDYYATATKPVNHPVTFLSYFYLLLTYDQLWAASLIGRNAVMWRWSLSYDQRVTVDRVSL